MKKIPLAAPAARFGCVLGDVLIAGAAALWLLLAFSWWALLVTALAGLLVGFYNVQVFRSVILVDTETGTITLQGIQARTDQADGASRVYTREGSVNGQATRVIVVEGADGSVHHLHPQYDKPWLRQRDRGAGAGQGAGSGVLPYRPTPSI